MTLSDRILSIKRILKPGLIALVSVFLGCETADDVGVSIPLETGVGVEFVEFTLPATNVYIDSLRTDQGNNVLVGNYSNPLTGSVQAEGYFSLSYISGTLPSNKISEQYVYDSVRISLKVPLAKFEEGNSNQEFVYHELIDTLNNDFIYLSSKSIEKKRQIGSDEFSVVDEDDEIVLNSELSIDFGLDVFNSGKNEDSMIGLSWPSIGITSGINSEIMSSILLTDDTSRVYLYITEPDGIIEEIVKEDTSYRDTTYQAEFLISTSKFSYIERNKTGSEFQGIEENSNFDLVTGNTLIEPLTGLSTAISLSNLKNFFAANSNFVINSASFSFEIQENNTSALENFMLYFRKPDLSFFGPAIKENQFGNIVATDNSYNFPLSNGALNFNQSVSYLSQESTYLSLDATNFLRNLYETSEGLEALYFQNPFEENPKVINDLVLISSVDVTLNQSVFVDDGVKLRIYYTKLGN